jgi:hypothetical protein
VDCELLKRQIEQQAIAYQSIWGWRWAAPADSLREDLSYRLHGEAYRAASREVREALIFPKWDADRSCATDIPELDSRRRVTIITANPIFPPLWRCRAYRSFLPDVLSADLSRWRDWAEQVARGEHDEYLQELHLHATSIFLRQHWSELRHLAVGSLSRAAAWANAPVLEEVRMRILELPEPATEAVRIDAGDAAIPGQEELRIRHDTVFAQVRALVALTHAWDAAVPGNKQLRYHERNYDLTLEQFRNRARAAGLHDFFDWVSRCLERGFALFLDD